MRQINLATQSQDVSLPPSKVATSTYQAVLDSRPVDSGVQAAAPVAVTLGAASVAITLAGPYVANGDATYTTLGRVVNKGTYVTKDTDPLPSTTPFLSSIATIRTSGTNDVIEDANGKEIVAFVTLNTLSGNTVALSFYSDLQNGTYAAATMPAAQSIVYQYIKRFSLYDAGLSPNKTLVSGAMDVEERADLNQLLADMLGSGYAFDGTGAGVLGAGQSLREQIANHLANPTDAHEASAIAVLPIGDMTSVDVQAALEEHQADLDALTAAVASLDSSAGASVAFLAYNTGANATADGVTYTATPNYVTNLNGVGVGDNHTQAITALDAAVFALASVVGIPQEGEKLTIAGDGSATLAWAHGMVAGCNPMLALNGSIENPGLILSGADFQITADGSGKLRNFQLSAASLAGFDTSGTSIDTASIWYRGALS